MTKWICVDVVVIYIEDGECRGLEWPVDTCLWMSKMKVIRARVNEQKSKKEKE